MQFLPWMATSGTRTTDGEVGSAPGVDHAGAIAERGEGSQVTFLRTLRLPDYSHPAANNPVPAEDWYFRRAMDRCHSRDSAMNPGIAETACPSCEHLELLVQRRLGSRVRDLRVLVRQDGVILQGRAGTYHAKQLAQHAAMELTALPILANDIEVR
jgi:hypothetical protein